MAIGFAKQRKGIQSKAWNVNFEVEMSRIAVLKELWVFMKFRKKWMLLPVIVVLLLVSALLIFAQGSALAPFIYSLF